MVSIAGFVLLYFSKQKKNDVKKLRSLKQKEELENYGKEMINRRLVHSIHLIENIFEKLGNIDEEDFKKLKDDVRVLEAASRDALTVEPEKDETVTNFRQLIRSAILKEFGGFLGEVKDDVTVMAIDSADQHHGQLNK